MIKKKIKRLIVETQQASRLPAGYTEADAIICYSGQWINTGITMNSEDEMMLDCDISDSSEPSFLMMGARTNFYTNNITFSKQSAGICCDFNNAGNNTDGNLYRFSSTQYTTGRYKIYASKTKRGAEGVGENAVEWNGSFTCPGPCYVGF